MTLSRRRTLGLLAAVAGTGTGVLGYRRWRRSRGRFRFGDAVDAELRSRCRRAATRTTEIVGESISEPVDVRLVDRQSEEEERGSRNRFDRAVAIARHTTTESIPSLLSQPAGSYDHRSRTIRFLDLAAVDRTDLDDAGVSFVPAATIDESLVAHELTHVVQDDHVGQSPPADSSRDASHARGGVIEGTADYVQGRYRAHCRDGRYEPCDVRESIEPASVPVGVLAEGYHRYVDGRLFVHAIREAHGWEGVWDCHRDPPARAVEIMFPDRYLAGGSNPARLESSPPPSSDWIEIRSDRLGAFELYTKLYALDVVSPTTDDARVDETVTEATTFEQSFRSELLRGLRGDLFTAYGYVDDLDRLAYRWRTRWERSADAAAFAEAIGRGYDDRGTRREDGWVLEDAFHTLERAGTTVTFGMGPDRAAALGGLGLANRRG